ncbi:unnamed protein product [Gongylonema pulchrum]|uniref:Uncharacterized protein n=1 Tax=Gongylonema pulchrum TaxID=637853 RepID=A0A3P6PCZ9_9BILA|nr:unnamed protein product [Gongylonema pulchrum]
MRFEQKHFLHYDLQEDESVSSPYTAARGEALHEYYSVAYGRRISSFIMENHAKVMHDIKEYVRKNKLDGSRHWIILPHWYKFQDYTVCDQLVRRYAGQLSIEIVDSRPAHFRPCRFKRERSKSPHHVPSQPPIYP